MDPNVILSAAFVSSLDENAKNDLRYKLQTDLFFLANNVLRNTKQPALLQKVHGGICDSLIKKYPTSNFGYTNNYQPAIIKPLPDWSDIKERVILSSRGTLKSTLEAADIVQIILCEPNVRITLLSGRLGLAKSILKMARSYFESNEVLQLLFPQWCSNIKINAEEFTSPARHGVNYRDPTVQVATFGSMKAGIRADYIKLDDATNEKNQATPELVEKSISDYDDLSPIVEPGGYIDFTGTRWAVDDLPEYLRMHASEMEKETGKQQLIYFFQPIWKLKDINDPSLSPEVISKLRREQQERERRHQLRPDDVDLLWPEKLTATYLWPQYRRNPRKFACQYLLNPDIVTTGTFTYNLLLRQTRPIEECPLPHRSLTFINWDLAGISGKGDYGVGVVGIWEETGRLYIIDAVIRKFRSSTEICTAIIGLFKKYCPDYHRIEAANGAELLAGELKIMAQQADLAIAFNPGWDPPINEANAKHTRIMLLPGALEANQLQFFEGIPDLNELYLQFTKYSAKGRYKNDGPDCIAQMYQKWKDSIGPRAINYITPSDVILDFQSQLPAPKSENIDPHADEKLYADIDFLSNMTMPRSGV